MACLYVTDFVVLTVSFSMIGQGRPRIVSASGYTRAWVGLNLIFKKKVTALAPAL